MSPRFSASGKRLGRPPKNKVTLAPAVNSNGKVVAVVVEPPPPVKKAEELHNKELEMISECEFVTIPEYEIIKVKDGEKRCGRYSGSNYWFNGFGKSKWVVLAYLKADFAKYRLEGMTNLQIVNRCLNFLNTPEPRKKFQKKEATSKYGELKLVREDIKFTNRFGYECAILEMSIDERKNEHFWGEGENLKFNG